MEACSLVNNTNITGSCAPVPTTSTVTHSTTSVTWLSVGFLFFFKWPSGKRHRLKCCREFITLLDLDKNGMRVVEFRARCYSYNNFGHVQFRLEKRYRHCHAPSFPPQFALPSHWKCLSYHLKIGIS